MAVNLQIRNPIMNRGFPASCCAGDTKVHTPESIPSTLKISNISPHPCRADKLSTGFGPLPTVAAYTIPIAWLQSSNDYLKSCWVHVQITTLHGEDFGDLAVEDLSLG